MSFNTSNHLRTLSLRLAFVVATVSTLLACGHHRHVARVGTDTQTDFSGKWNDSDAQATAKALIGDCLSAGWLNAFNDAQGRKPALRVRRIVNKTDEHIDAQIFLKSFERAMINSGKVVVLAQEGTELSSVEAEQDRGVSGAQRDDTPVEIGQETGADFVLTVRMASIPDQVDGKKAIFYSINAELISPTSGEKAWIGQHELKKVVSQSAVGW